jgi:hypothetical protein
LGDISADRFILIYIDSLSLSLSLYIYIYIYIYACMDVHIRTYTAIYNIYNSPKLSEAALDMVVLTHHADQQRPALPRSLLAIAPILRLAHFALFPFMMASALEKVLVVCVTNSAESMS